MRTHPDVTEVVAAAAPDDLRLVYGIATLVDAGERIYAVGLGTGSLLVRGDVGDDATTIEGLDGWIRVSAFAGGVADLVRESAVRTAATRAPDA